jgi:hypothetical protein
MTAVQWIGAGLLAWAALVVLLYRAEVRRWL